uniref:Uncharacterized protein n=1 Tax=Ditylenchus dipsaci TaxID=166011 RepID=A0A915DCD9_9BILA
MKVEEKLCLQRCPTRTASLHVANNQNNSNNAASNTQSSAISLANNNNNSNTISSHTITTIPSNPVLYGTEMCPPDRSVWGQQAHPQSRFMRTFSVMAANLEQPSRRKTLDDEVLQLIDSCRRYQDERLQSHQIQNFLLEEEGILEEEEEHVTQLLAGR